jgi:regulatory protein
MDINDAKSKAARYCAYQDRARFEVEEKLKSYGLGIRQIKKILVELADEGFIDEKRFSKVFSLGKFRNNKWGKIKIRQHLLLKQVPKDVIEQGLNDIPDDEYFAMIKFLIKLKGSFFDEPDDFIRNNRIAAYLSQKGFEPELIWDALKE